MKKKLLLISISTGSGHTRAAEAIRKTAALSFPDIETTHIDMADYIRLPMKMAILRSYDMLIKQSPSLWGFLYKKTDNPSLVRKLRALSALTNRMNASALIAYVKNLNPDYILATHFLPAQALLGSKLQGEQFRPSIVLTDYDKHALLIHDGMRDYFVATDRMKYRMEKGGIAEDKITVTGIPVDPVFLMPKSIPELKQKHGINPQPPVALILSGGQGLTNIDELVQALFSLPKPLTIIAIAGSNTKLEQKLRSLQPPAHMAFYPIGWTDTIDEYMRMADVIVSKPGGLTTTEAITLGKPIIAYQPIPGQEEHNAEYILEHNYGRVAHDINDVVYYLDKIARKEIICEQKKSASLETCAAMKILAHITHA